MILEAKDIQNNWVQFMANIDAHITGERKRKLIEFYEKYQERIMLMPAAHKKEYHNAFPGGYVEHVNRVVRCALKQHDLWASEGVNTSTYTIEELVFSALNHDLGKMGDEENESYIPQTDQWRKDKLGEDYMFNTKVPFASVQIVVYSSSNHMVFSIPLMKCLLFKLTMVYMMKQIRNT